MTPLEELVKLADEIERRWPEAPPPRPQLRVIEGGAKRPSKRRARLRVVMPDE